MQPKQITGPLIFHLELNEGMDHQFQFVYVDESTLLPVDLTGYKADLYVRKTSGSVQILKGLTSSFSYPEGSISLTSEGSITINVRSEFTTNLNWYDAVYDLVLTTPDLRRTKLIRGKVNIYNTLAFPQVYNPNTPESSMTLTVGVTTLPNEVILYGYLNPLKMGLGGGLLLTGDLRPSTHGEMEIAELSYSSSRLRLVFLGNVPEDMFTTMRLGSMGIRFSDSDGRVFNPSAANGLGLTYWEWRNLDNPFGDAEGTIVRITFE